jgi:hypothetical protein
MSEGMVPIHPVRPSLPDISKVPKHIGSARLVRKPVLLVYWNALLSWLRLVGDVVGSAIAQKRVIGLNRSSLSFGCLDWVKRTRRTCKLIQWQ